MNAITIFNDVTTEEALQAIEAEAENYTGLYVDMNEAKGRKFVKEQAANIGDILKRLDRARIDKAKEYKQAVENEASAIRYRLEEANKPFTLLIDEYTAERKKILDAENARKKAIEDQAAIDSDYEIAVLLMEKYFSDKAKAEQQRIAYEETLKRQAVEDAEKSARLKEAQLLIKAEADKRAAVQEEVDRQQREKEALAAEQTRREADTENKRRVNNEILADLTDAGISEACAKKVIALFAKGYVRNVKVIY
jgi:hypothetical protein